MSEGLSAEKFSLDAGGTAILRDASFEIQPGGLVLLLGISGGGKSTLLRVLSGLENVEVWETPIRYHGQIEWKPALQSHEIGLVFQQPALMDELNATANVQLVLDHRRQKQKEKGEARKRLEALSIPAATPVLQLSGGQKQRLSLAASLAGDPKVIIYDEPTTGLDEPNANKVAELISETHRDHQLTTIVVTHDYKHFRPYSTQILLIDNAAHKVVDATDWTHERMERQLEALATHSQMITEPRQRSMAESMLLPWVHMGGWIQFLVKFASCLVPVRGRFRWQWYFLRRAFSLVSGVTAVIYLLIAGVLLGFVATYFSLKHLPFRTYTEPLLLEELMAALGFTLYRIFVPLLAHLLVAARSTAAMAAYLGNKRLGGQLESLRLQAVPIENYLQTATLWAFLTGTILLEVIAFVAARYASLFALQISRPDHPVSVYWDLHFHSVLREPDMWLWKGTAWVFAKSIICGFGIAAICYRLSTRRMTSSMDVSAAITRVILWSTLWVLVVHFVMALIEYD